MNVEKQLFKSEEGKRVEKLWANKVNSQIDELEDCTEIENINV